LQFLKTAFILNGVQKSEAHVYPIFFIIPGFSTKEKSTIGKNVLWLHGWPGAASHGATVGSFLLWIFFSTKTGYNKKNRINMRFTFLHPI
jgi:hypothetical protein